VEVSGEPQRGLAGGGGLTGRQWIGFFVLCLLGASGWLVEGAWPSLLPVAAQDCMHDVAIGLAVGVFGWKKIARGDLGGRSWAKLAIASVCLLGLPTVLIEWARSGVSDGTVAGLFALLPIAVVLVMPQFNLGMEVENGVGRLLAPALIGLAGALLLVPFALPDSLRSAGMDAVVVLAVVTAASASVWMYRLLHEFAVIEAVLICCFANAALLMVVFLGSSLMAGSGEALRMEWSWRAAGVEMVKAACFDLPQVWLLLWLMRAVSPVRLSVRALLVPLLTVAEGEAMMRPGIAARTLVGAVLLVLGAWRLMAGGEQEEPGLMLR
jgi:hypothetical protein